MKTISQRIKYFINWENTLILCMLIIAIFIGALIFVVGCQRSYIWMCEKKQELDLSNAINKEFINIMNLTTQLKIDLTDKEEKELEDIKIKSKYDAQELSKQQQYLIKYQTKIAENICPYGSWVKLIEKTEHGERYTPVKVLGHYGYEAQTYENINFMTIETDNWKFIDQEEYDWLKKVNK